uniref:Uncharacterized protein n=1 Tax=Tetranychus urticae TaxID=32264 RepID=T1K109_TETUR
MVENIRDVISSFIHHHPHHYQQKKSQLETQNYL